MNRLTQEERRRLNQAKQRASDAMLAYPTLPAEVTVIGGSRGRTRVLQLVTLLVLLCGGLLAYQVVEFNPPTSLIDALLPRL